MSYQILKIIHVNLYTLKVKKNSQHCPLKGSWGVTQPKGKHMVGEFSPWECEGSLVLILR